MKKVARKVARPSKSKRASPESNYVPSPRLASREIEGQVLVLLPNDMDIYTFNASGALIWKGLGRNHAPSRIAADLSKAFGIDLATAEADVASFVREMARRKLLIRRGR